jgi:phosphinothricin acetyltransferase
MHAIVPAEPRHAAAVASIYAPLVRDTAISFETEPPDAREMARRIESTLPRHPWLVYEEDGVARGYAYAGHHRARAAYRWSVEVSVYVAPQAHRSGVGTGLYAALLEILAIQGFRRAYAGITLPNPGSVALHEAAGFAPVGVYHAVGFKCHVWHDVGWWERALVDGGEPPQEPTPFDRLSGDPALAHALVAGTARIRA